MPAPVEVYRPANPPSPKPYLSYGLPFHQAAAKHAEHSFHASRIYVVVSATISKTKDWTALQDALGRDKIVGVRYGIRPHTPIHEVLELAADLRDAQPDLVIAFGAGSVLDGVKIARLFAANDVLTDAARRTLWGDDDETDIFAAHDRADLRPATIPCLFVPTSLSGGEWTSLAGATDAAGHKAPYTHSSMLADLVVYDPAATVPVPDRWWFSTGVRAIDHCVEAMSSTRHDDSVPEAEAEASRDVLAAALRDLLSDLLALRTRDRHDDLAARLRCLLATAPLPRALALGVGASHGIGHQLGPLGVGHGETSCVLLPSVLRFNWRRGDALARRRQARVRDVFWSAPGLRELFEREGLREKEKEEDAVGHLGPPDASDDDGATELGVLLDVYLRALGVPRTLRGVGIRREQLDALAEGSLKEQFTNNGPVEVGKKEVLEILEMSWDDWGGSKELAGAENKSVASCRRRMDKTQLVTAAVLAFKNLKSSVTAVVCQQRGTSIGKLR